MFSFKLNGTIFDLKWNISGCHCNPSFQSHVVNKQRSTIEYMKIQCCYINLDEQTEIQFTSMLKVLMAFAYSLTYFAAFSKCCLMFY